jgi:hypothetical protein
MIEKRSRRQFSTQYKLRIIAQTDHCRRGELGALLRRENARLTRKLEIANGCLSLQKTLQMLDQMNNGDDECRFSSLSGRRAVRCRQPAAHWL